VVDVSTGRVRVPPPVRRAAAWAAGGVLRRYGGRGKSEVCVAFVGDRRIRNLNRCYLGRDGVTDVLSFPLGEKVDGRTHRGDVIISLPRARVQARHFGHSLAKEVAVLSIHGTLHLLGYEHRGTARDVMARAERAVLRRFRGGT